MSDTEKPWRVACESGRCFPTLDNYTPIPATVDNACLMAAAPQLKRALEAFLRDGDKPTTRELASRALELAEL